MEKGFETPLHNLGEIITQSSAKDLKYPRGHTESFSIFQLNAECLRDYIGI